MRCTLLVSVTDDRDENTDCERLMMKRQDSTFCPNDEWVMRALVLASLFVTPVSTPVSAAERSGLEVVALCSKTDDSHPTPPRCRKYFAETLQLLNARPAGPRHAACPPSWFSPEDAISLYLIEARQFPDVLHVLAVQLIEGMLLKFYPCISV